MMYRLAHVFVALDGVFTEIPMSIQIRLPGIPNGGSREAATTLQSPTNGFSLLELAAESVSDNISL